MAKGDRVLDPEAIQDFQQYIQAQLDHLDNVVVPSMESGTLSYAPAFGRLDSSVQAARVYNDFFGATWDNVQQLRGVYKAMLKQLNGALGAHDESETANTADTTNIDGQMTA
ncbi:hypothetical protein [Natronoglycomyces albus]|uniref:Uncharacterized protein n=1 Tax=Natronoglycomyces albus TaxID=2811108 RepID=A0A895XS02_9ACTN|nr:hypothetical protein [Natronoglycomyces albus]QSB05040.1 hypothetical protein JQS30_14960 [Natronoglycomyces albus]